MLKRFAAAALVCAIVSAAQAAERTIIVLDASGSMWGVIDGKPKLEIARETLRNVLTTVPADAELGLMAYGHREKGNCDDIELVVPPAPGTAAAITEAADRMRFLGKTPLTQAVRHAAEATRYTEEKATVVLVTDGLETCSADPCALGRELEKSGVDFTAHVVGLGLSRDEGRQVACLAETTGGRYIKADDAAQLREALSKTVAAKVETPQPVTLPKAGISVGDKPTIGQSFDVAWTGPAGANDYIDIVPAGTEEIGGELFFAYVKEGATLAMRAPGEPGAYDIRYIWEGPDKRHVLASARIEVVASENALVAPASVSVGQGFEVAWKGPGQDGDYVDLVAEGHVETAGELSFAYVKESNPVRLRAPGKAGPYLLRYILSAPDGRKMLVSVPLAVTEATASVSFPQSVMAGTEINVAWKGPAASGDYVDLVPAGRADTSGEISFSYVEQSQDSETVVLRAPADAGKYQIRYVLEAADGKQVLASQPLEVKPVEASLKAPAAVEKGAQFEVEWTGPAATGDYVDLVPKGHADTTGELSFEYVTSAQEERRVALTAPEQAGEYEVRYVLEAPDGKRVVASAPLMVE
ncbi:VWA domain-containing protein [Mesorhizobium sp. ANAO-SY3R2]|uniref:VWA domain-containing protein n=1 Tax=Mesorhizobium sp. ANAO-SY3R2 TaxID=3166644 RepID=UPI00366B0D48